MSFIPVIIGISLVLTPTPVAAPPKEPKSQSAFLVMLSPAMQLVVGTTMKVKAFITSTTSSTELARSTYLGCSGIDIVHIETETGSEPEKTEWYRHQLGDYRPGDLLRPEAGSCVSVELRSGETIAWTYNLSTYYHLTKPGRYKLWIETNDAVRDPKGQTWEWIPVRSNTVSFDLISPP